MTKQKWQRESFPLGSSGEEYCPEHGYQGMSSGAFCAGCGKKLIPSPACDRCGHRRYHLSDRFCRNCGLRWTN